MEEIIDIEKLRLDVFAPEYPGFDPEENELLRIVGALASAEGELLELCQRQSELNTNIELLQHALHKIKRAMHEKQKRLKEAFEMGGVQPTEEYPEFIDEHKVTYHTKDYIATTSEKGYELLHESDGDIPTEQVSDDQSEWD